MIVLDTNVLSELMRFPVAEPVSRWAARQKMADLYSSAVSQAEILSGLETMPHGKRRDMLSGSARNLFEVRLLDRILPFDSAAASVYADIVASRRRAGRPIGTFDAQIAAIAQVAGATVATRNIRDFEACGIKVVDPWAA